MLGPLLPPRNHTLHVQVKKADGSYESIEVNPSSGRRNAPAWIDEFREKAIADYEAERDSVEEGEYFSWPKTLADWDNERRRRVLGEPGARHPRRRASTPRT